VHINTHCRISNVFGIDEQMYRCHAKAKNVRSVCCTDNSDLWRQVCRCSYIIVLIHVIVLGGCYVPIIVPDISELF
jgi:hypothetical protein